MKRFIYMFAVLLLLISGCSSGKKANENIEFTASTITSGEKGEDGFVQLDIKGLQEKISANERFVVMISQSTCSYCNTMKLILHPYFQEYPDVPFYEIEMDMLGTKKSDTSTYFSELKSLVPEYGGATPEFFYFEEGSMKEQKSGAMSKVEWHNFLKDCGLVEGEVKAQATTTIASSDNLKNETFTNINERITNKDEFYLLCVENDRFGAEFSNTLKSYVEEQGIDISYLNFTSPRKEVDEEKMQTSYESVMAILNMSFTPTLYKIKDGKVVSTLQDNASISDIETWFEQQ